MMKKAAIMMFAVLILAAGSDGLFGQAPVSEKLASGTYIVYAPAPQIWRVKVDPKTMANVTISGHFQVTAGVPKAVEVFVFNEENYAKWKDEDPTVRAAAKPTDSVNRSAEGNINAKLTDPGYHYLVISDRFEYQGQKTVAADVKLQYDKR